MNIQSLHFIKRPGEVFDALDLNTPMSSLSPQALLTLPYYVSRSKKREKFCAVAKFFFVSNRTYLQGCDRYRFETRYGDFFNHCSALTEKYVHLCISGMGVAIASIARSQSGILCLTLELHHFNLVTLSNIGFL